MIQNGMRSVSVRTTSESKWNSGTAAVSKLPFLSPYQCICFTTDRCQGTHSTKKLRIDHDIMADPTSPADIFTGQHMSAARPTIDQSSVLTTSRIFLTFPSLCYPRSIQDFTLISTHAIDATVENCLPLVVARDRVCSWGMQSQATGCKPHFSLLMAWHQKWRLRLGNAMLAASSIGHINHTEIILYIYIYIYVNS